MVYFITDSNYTKIGSTLDSSKRLKQLQTGNPSQLQIVFEIQGGYIEEKYLHNYFKEYRIGTSEWFKLPSLVTKEFVENIAKEIAVVEKEIKSIKVPPVRSKSINPLIDWNTFIDIAMSDEYSEEDTYTTLYHNISSDLLFSLSPKARDILFYILLNIKPQEDFIPLSLQTINKKAKMSRQSYYQGLKELKDNWFIATKSQGIFWVNPQFIFNGNRQKFVKEFYPDKIVVVYNLPTSSLVFE